MALMAIVVVKKTPAILKVANVQNVQIYWGIVAITFATTAKMFISRR